MKLLLDSHTFVWMREQPHRIGVIAVTEILKPSNQIFLSVASIWELQIKIMNGKFAFSDPFEQIIADESRENGVEILEISLEHALFLKNLPNQHKDPFDRMLTAQAFVENMTIVSRDPRFRDYGVPVVW